MKKPLSEKTLDKKYAELGLSKEKTDLLHTYFLCCSNLYGLVQLRDVWEIFLNYEKAGTVRRKDFLAFSEIAAREEQPYVILECNEVFSASTDCGALDRLLINRKLIGNGYYRFNDIIMLNEEQIEFALYCPETREEFFSYTEDRFWLTAEGAAMEQFLRTLKTTGQCLIRKYPEPVTAPIKDLDGNPVRGKKLGDFRFYTRSETGDIDYEKREARKEQLRTRYAVTALEKVKHLIWYEIQNIRRWEPDEERIGFVLRLLDEDFGVSMTKKQTEAFLRLYCELNNHSVLWCRSGWSPDRLARLVLPGGNPEIAFGPGIQKLFDSGEIDRAELTEMLRENGFTVKD